MIEPGFSDLVKRISPKLKGITHKLNGHFSFFNEDDLYQEAACHLWVDYKEGKLWDKTDSYILQGCYFRLKNYIRKVRDKVSLTSIHKLINEEGALGLEESLFLEDPKSYFDDISNKVLIEEILNDGLTKREKEVFCLRLKGLTMREIAQALGISHVRVVKLQNRIKEKCQRFKDTV